jgi:hypothetical protein
MADGQAQAAPAPASKGPDLVTPVGADPVSRIQAMLDAENAPPQAPQPEQAPAQPEATPEVEAPAVPNTQVEGDDAPVTEDARRMAEIPLDQLEAIELELTVKGEDGKDVVEKPTIKELREGYMRQKDYSRKTAEVARQREETGEKVRQAIDSERSQLQKTLQEVQALLLETAAPELKDVNWNELATNDPFTYVQRRNRADQIAQALNTVKARQQELETKQKTERESTHKQSIEKARETLQRDVPGWTDSLYQEIIKGADAFGFKPEEVANWLDPRAIKLLHSAMQAKKSAPQKPSTDKKVTLPPKVVKPGAAQELSATQQRQQSAVQRLQKSGNLDDAAAVIRGRL